MAAMTSLARESGGRASYVGFPSRIPAWHNKRLQPTTGRFMAWELRALATETHDVTWHTRGLA